MNGVREYGDDVSAYVASYTWIVEHVDQATAERFRGELFDEGAATVAGWNAACDDLADYARRNADRSEWKWFENAKLAHHPSIGRGQL